MLARIICRGPTPGTDQTHNGSGIDNGTIPLLKHLDNFVLHTEPHALQINGENLVPDVFGAFMQGGTYATGNARIIMGTVETPIGLHGLRDHRLDGGCLGYIDLDEDGFPTVFRNHMDGLLSTV